MDEAAERQLIAEVLGGSGSAWRRFFARHAATVDKLVRASASMGSLRHDDDERRNVMALVFEKLRKDNSQALRTFDAWSSANPDKRFSDWLTIVVTNVVRDHLRSKLGARSADGERNKRMVNTLAGALDDSPDLAVRPSFTNQGAAHEILDFATEHLPSDQLAALRGWLQGEDFDAIARALHLASPRDADKLVRAALARLRREF